MQILEDISHEKINALENPHQKIPKSALLLLFGVDSLDNIDVFLHPDSAPQANMDFDHQRALVLASGEPLVKPMLRLYSWKPHAVSLGAHQKESDIDADRAKALGVAVVRRPTGGRAIFHADELTYSIVLPLKNRFCATRTVHDVYREIHVLLLRALQSLGVAGLDFEKKQADFRQHYRRGDVAMPCFASSARYELLFEGRKVVGSAQRLYGEALLQHGSILLGAGHERLADVLNISSDEAREDIRQMMCMGSATVREAAGRPISFAECADAVLSAFGVGKCW